MDRTDLIDRVRQEYADTYGQMKWLDSRQAGRSEEHRRMLLERMGQNLNWSFSRTKPHTGELSPGCRLCGQGQWSCLFVNNLCNARCFYCPSPQEEAGVPGTNSLDFKNPEDYADYVKTFGIRGVSFSGGEPMMTQDRVLRFLSVLRKRVRSPLHIWMYTNGLLINRDNLRALGEAGLDEIRFDISANRYLLDKVEQAVGVIPLVTVEIPAIPEDMGRLRNLVRDLPAMGVNHLNLHQLRCTRHNRMNLIQRGYTFLHGPKVTVLETELAALELMAYTLEQKISLPVNYCAYVYRHQYQSAGSRRRNALRIRAGYESVTENGHIRTLALTGDPAAAQAAERFLEENRKDRALWHRPKPGSRLFIHPSLLPDLPRQGLALNLSYFATTLKPAVSYRHPFTEVPLNARKTVFIEKKAELRDRILDEAETRDLSDGCAPGRETCEGDFWKDAKPPADLSPWEGFEQGLAPYF
jgi:pyruvate formate-lyase activating enzyme-like uncharacterized protein